MAEVFSKRTIEGQYVVMQADLGGAKLENIGLVLLDADLNQLYLRFRRDFSDVVGDEADWFEHLADDILVQSLELGARRYLDWCESTLCSRLRISLRGSLLVDDYDKTVNRLYAKHVQAKVLPFRTHLP